MYEKKIQQRKKTNNVISLVIFSLYIALNIKF
jgi:hypothetical protein